MGKNGKKWNRALFRTLAYIICWGSLLWLTAGCAITPRIADNIRTQIASLQAPSPPSETPSLFSIPRLVDRFYEKRNYLPAWIDKEGVLPQAQVLVQALRDASQEGLDPQDYFLSDIERGFREIGQTAIFQKWSRVPQMAQWDRMLTHAFFRYSSHLIAGRVAPDSIDPQWQVKRLQQIDLLQLLETALAQRTIQSTLTQLLPPQRGYQRLREALAKYRHIETQGGWPTIDPDPPFRKRQRDPRLVTIRHRLRMEGDLPSTPSPDDDLYDDRLSPAIRRFQQRHGLKQNGLLNGPTRHLFTIALPSRIEQIQLNMERWRWLPRNFEERYLIVNIASFRLSMIENNKSLINMRVVVGKLYRRTPIFSAKMDHLVLNPYWYIPTKIAIEDKLPLIRQNPNYLKQKHVDVFLRLKSGFRPIDPSTINWEEVTPANFNYLLRQSPGPLNPLGRLKFIFPNRFDVYLHDTPSRHLFGQTSRDFSSGCIRLEKPIELAQYLLRDDPKLNRQRLVDTIQQGQERIIPLERPVPVYLLYWTAWGTQDGRVHFREDLYGRDVVLMNTL